MKKIFAFILATIMVMSLVPASVFAAFGNACPAIHTTANCSNKTEVKTVDPSCTTTGYTLYVCNVCGVQFTDNVKAKLSHNWVSNPDKAKNDIEASCLYQTPGISYQRCSVCKTERPEKDCTVSWNSTSVHNLVKVSGVGCEELYECTICKAQGYKVKNELSATASHTLEFKGIVTEPKWENGVAVEGLATYKCKTKNCTFEKEVPVKVPACQCTSKTQLKTEKDSTCAAEGTYGVYKCDACATLWYDSNIKTGDKNVKLEKLTDLNGDKAITVEDAIIAVKAHTKPSSGVATNGCTEVYTCTKCKQTVVEEKHIGVQDGAMKPVEATCITYGYSYKTCIACGTTWPEFVEPLGHEEATLVIESNCAVQGGIYTYCTRPGCPVVPSTPKNAPEGTSIKVVKVELFPLDKTKHDIKYVGGTDYEENASCTTSGLVITTCANGCTEYAVPKVEFKPATNHDFKVYRTTHNCSTATATLSSWATRTYYFCANCGLNTKDDYQALGYTSPYYVDVRDMAIKNEFETENDALEYHGIIARTWKLVDGKLVEDTVTMRSEIKHTFKEISSVGTTCKARGYTIYSCTGCNQSFKVWSNEPVPAHTDSNKKNGTVATCNTAGKYTTYTCSVCKLTYYYNVKGEQVVFTGSAPAINPCGDPSTLTVVKGCGGTEYYYCTKCKTYYDSEACTNAVTPSEVNDHDWKVVYGGKAATCSADGELEVRYCTGCAATEVNALYIFNGKEERIELATGNYKKAAVVATINNKNILDKEVFVQVNTKGEVSFTCETVTTSNCTVAVKKLNHVKPNTWESAMTKVENDTKVAADHTTAMFTRHICSGCDFEYIDNYVAAAAGHINSKGNLLTNKCDNEGVAGGRVCVLCVAAGKSTEQATITVKHTLSGKTVSTMTCQSDGYTYEYCTKCGFGAPDNLVASNAKTYHDNLAKDINASYKDKKVYVNGTVADYAHNGAYTWACALCDAKVKDGAKANNNIAAGLEIYANVQAATVLPGATVKVDITLESLKGVNVWALAFPVVFDATVFEFVGYEWNTAKSAFQTFAVTEVAGGLITDTIKVQTGEGEYDYNEYLVTDGKQYGSGVLHIVANADTDVKIKAEETLVTLEFKVINANVVENQTFDVVNEVLVSSGGSFGKKLAELCKDTINPFNGTKYVDDAMWMAYYGNVLYEVTTNPTYKYITTEVLNADGAKVNVNYNTVNSSEPLEIADYLNLDDNYGISLSDAYALYALIYNNEYDVRADANYDGKVDGRDLSILYAVYTGVVTIEQLISPSAELPEGFEAWMGAR